MMTVDRLLHHLIDLGPAVARKGERPSVCLVVSHNWRRVNVLK
jgi:hypothetical protein